MEMNLTKQFNCLSNIQPSLFIFLFSFARNEIDVILDLLTNLLDTSRLVWKERTSTKKLSNLQWHKKMLINKQTKIEALKTNSLDFTHFLSNLKELVSSQQQFHSKISPIKSSLKFTNKILLGHSQLYIDYGLKGFKNYSGLALVRNVQGNLSISVPNEHFKNQRLKIKIMNLDSVSKLEYLEDKRNNNSLINPFYQLEHDCFVVEKEFESLLNLESFDCLKESFILNNNLTNKSSNGFDVVLSIRSKIVLVNVSTTSTCDLSIGYSKIEFYSLQLLIEVLLKRIELKSVAQLFCQYLTDNFNFS